MDFAIVRHRLVGGLLLLAAVLMRPAATGFWLAAPWPLRGRHWIAAVFLQFSLALLGGYFVRGGQLRTRLGGLLVLTALFPVAGGLYANAVLLTRRSPRAAPTLSESEAVQAARAKVESWSAVVSQPPSSVSLPGLNLTFTTQPRERPSLSGGFYCSSIRPKGLQEMRTRVTLTGKAQGRFQRVVADQIWKLRQDTWKLDSSKVANLLEVSGPSPWFLEVPVPSLRECPYQQRIERSLAGEKGLDTSMYLGVVRRPAVSVVDVDRDGWDDLFLVRRAGDCVMLRNNQDGSFSDIAPKLGLNLPGPVFCALFADFDNDGDSDAVLGLGNGATYWENVAGQFQARMGFPATGQVASLAAADIDGDGRLELFAASITQGSSLLRLSGHEWKKIQGVAFPPVRAIQGVFSDFDLDGHPDFYLVGNGLSDQLYHNQAGKLVPMGGVANSLAGEARSATVGDVNADGWPDVYVAQPDGRSLLIMNHRGRLKVLSESGLGDCGWPTGAQFVDLNGDGAPDLHIPTGLYTAPAEGPQPQGQSVQARQPHRTFLNLGPKGFLEVTGLTGLDVDGDGRGFAHFDYDHDGRVDLALVNLNRPFFQLFHNELPKQPFVAVRLVGSTSNRDAIGARVQVGEVTQELRAGEGFGSQNSLTLFFPPGKLEVLWPSGKRQSYPPVKSGSLVLFKEGSVPKVSLYR